GLFGKNLQLGCAAEPISPASESCLAMRQSHRCPGSRSPVRGVGSDGIPRLSPRPQTRLPGPRRLPAGRGHPAAPRPWPARARALGARSWGLLLRTGTPAPAGLKPTPAVNTTLSTADVQTLLQRAARATASDNAIVAVVDRGGNVLGVRVEGNVSPQITGNTE